MLPKRAVSGFGLAILQRILLSRSKSRSIATVPLATIILSKKVQFALPGFFQATCGARDIRGLLKSKSNRGVI